MGGTGSIVRALGSLLERNGVEFILGDGVDRIDAKRGRIDSVALESGERLTPDTLVSNADPVTLYREMLPPRGAHRASRRRAKRMKLSMGLFVSYFGASRTYDDLAHHTIILSDRYKDLLTDIFDRGIVPDEPSLYLHAPTRTDASMAPEGHECFYVLAPVPNLAHTDDWDEREGSFHQRALRRIESTVAPGLIDSLATRFCVTPKYFETELRSPAGAGFSVQPTLSQSAYFRFHNRCPHYANLFLVGAGTHPGAGIPGTLCTAKTMENAMLREGLLR
jgi:phytoene desaturase